MEAKKMRDEAIQMMKEAEIMRMGSTHGIIKRDIAEHRREEKVDHYVNPERRRHLPVEGTTRYDHGTKKEPKQEEMPAAPLGQTGDSTPREDDDTIKWRRDNSPKRRRSRVRHDEKDQRGLYGDHKSKQEKKRIGMNGLMRAFAANKPRFGGNWDEGMNNTIIVFDILAETFEVTNDEKLKIIAGRDNSLIY